jgi:hypothetical protein
MYVLNLNPEDQWIKQYYLALLKDDLIDMDSNYKMLIEEI